jgi:hypothetical protein
MARSLVRLLVHRELAGGQNDRQGRAGSREEIHPPRVSLRSSALGLARQACAVGLSDAAVNGL